MAIKKLCANSGCNELLEIGQRYCDKHQIVYETEQKQRHKTYKQQRTDIREQSFYDSKEWIMTRDYIKAKYNAIDLYNYYVKGRLVLADCVHHIIELKDTGGWELRVSESNLIPLSYASHNEIHGMYNSGRKMDTQQLLRELKMRWENEMRHGS